MIITTSVTILDIVATLLFFIIVILTVIIIGGFTVKVTFAPNSLTGDERLEWLPGLLPALQCSTIVNIIMLIVIILRQDKSSPHTRQLTCVADGKPSSPLDS